MKIYLALDGTADVDRAKRCREAAKLGPLARVCTLPAGLDPDDLEPEQLAGVKQSAAPVLAAWLEWFDELAAEPEARAAALKELAPLLAAWDAEQPALAGERKDMLCAALGLDDAQYRAWLAQGRAAAKAVKAPAEKPGPKPACDSRWKGDPDWPGQPLPPSLPEGDERAVISNARVKPEKKVDAEGNETTVYKTFREPIDAVIDQVRGALNGFPFRWGPPGEQYPTLFMPDGSGSIRPVHTPKMLQTLCHEYATLKFRERNDSQGSNFVNWDNLFHYFGSSSGVSGYKGIALRPHEPAMQDFFYTWTPPQDYVPDGRYLLRCLELFDNIATPAMKAIFAAAICTPYWGGPCGARPCIVFAAGAPGWGKGRASELVGLPAGGMLELQGGKEAEKELFQRILSGDSWWKSVIRFDNLRTVLSSQLIESLITLPEVSGKKMYKGEGSRPNNMLMIVTANSIRVSPDMARRAFFVELRKPQENDAWEAAYRDVLDHHQAELIADCLHVLRQPRPEADIDGSGETFGLWVRGVLARVAAFPLFKEILGELDLRQVVEANMEMRTQVDVAHEEAEEFGQALIRYLAAVRRWVKREPVPTGGTRWLVQEWPKGEERITADDLEAVWKRCFGGKDKKNWICRTINNHIKAGRLAWLRPARVGAGSRYDISADAFTDYLKQVEAGEADVDEVTYDQPS